MQVLQDAAAGGLDVTTRVTAWDAYKSPRPVGPEQLGKHYADWCLQARTLGLFPIEYLVPLIKVPFDVRLPPSMALADRAFVERRAEMPVPNKMRWGYYFNLGGGFSTLGEETSLDGGSRLSRQRSLHRMRIIGSTAHLLCGGTLAGMTVLDMACNWGAFSMEMAARGAARVHGCDLRDDNVAKAHSLARYLDLPSCVFSVANVYDMPAEPTYDLVLNLGLMYHVTKQYELVQKTFELCRRAAIIETITHREPFSGFVLGWHKGRAEHSAGEIFAEIHPTYRALIDLMYMVGFREVLELDGEPDPEWTGYAQDPFGNKTRRFLVGLK